MDEHEVSVRYVCTGISEESENGVLGARLIHTLVFAPDPTDDSYKHGSILRLGFLERSQLEGFQASYPVLVTITMLPMSEPAAVETAE